MYVMEHLHLQLHLQLLKVQSLLNTQHNENSKLLARRSIYRNSLDDSNNSLTNLNLFKIMAWLTGYTYRKKITITGQSGSGTDYQVAFSIGDSSGGDFHLGGHCESYPTDIRFTDNDGETELKYWIEQTSADPIKVWVKVADDLGSNVDIYIYYGKSGDSDGSDGDNTFPLFFDDFEGGNLDKWTAESGSSVITSSKYYSGSHCLYGASNTGNHNIVRCDVSHSENIAIQHRMWRATGQAAVFIQGNGTKAMDAQIACGDEYIKYHDGTPTSTGTLTPASTWFLLEYRNFDWNAHTFDIVLNGSVIKTGADMLTFGSFEDEFRIQMNDNHTIYIDDVIVRSFHDSEPAWSSTGDEESLGINTQINIADSWKDASKIQINVGDDWKDVTKVQINVGDSWKTIF